MKKLKSHLCGCVVLLVLLAQSGCAGVGVPATESPEIKLSQASTLLSQGRPLITERLIREAIETLKQRNDAHGLGHAWRQYAELLRSPAVVRSEVPYRRDGFLDKTITFDTRFSKAKEFDALARGEYERAEQDHLNTKKFDALTNVYINLAWLQEDPKKTCDYFAKSLEAYEQNIRLNPQAKPATPEKGQSIPSIVGDWMTKAKCQ